MFLQGNFLTRLSTAVFVVLALTVKVYSNEIAHATPGSSSSSVQTQAPFSPIEMDQKFKTWTESVRYYKQRYGLVDLYSKRIDNVGEGFEELYGLRNMRVVLQGVFYRGGANNYYNKHGVRPNKNPMPQEGLENLCKENFRDVIYLYKDNFDTASNVSCTSILQQKNHTNYVQLSAMDEPKQVSILKIIFNHIQNFETQPIFGHCWNGWHASGLISALTLMQFCQFTSQEALEYWKKNTDGNDKGYDNIITRIKDFKPIAELSVSEAIQREMCLQIGTRK